VLTLAISGCSFLPAPLAYLNYARTGYDAVQIATDGTTLADKVLSEVTEMDCKFFNLLEDEDICAVRSRVKKITKEYVKPDSDIWVE
jgi:hypothetical protein